MGQQLFVKASMWDNNFLFKHIYGTRTFLTEIESCSRGSWWFYLSRKNDILWTILLKPRFYLTVVVSRCW